MQQDERISAKLKKFRPSLTLELKNEAQARRQRGETVFDFGLGETRGSHLDPVILEAGIEAFRHERTGYAEPAGLLELREQVLKWIPNTTHYSTDNVVISNGAKQSLFNIFLATCNPGDCVLFDSAPWVSYTPMANMAYTTPIQVLPFSRPNAYLKIGPEDLERNLTMRPHAKIFLLNNPVNPTGQLYDQGELDALLEVCSRHSVYFLLDRLYWKLVYDGAEYPEPYPNRLAPDWLIQVDGMSKNFSRAGGLRIGWTLAPRDVAKAMINLQSHYTSGPPTPLQYAALAAITKPYRGRLRRELQSRRDLLHECAKDIPHVKIWPTAGAFYSFWDVRGVFGKKVNNSDEVSYALAREGVIAASGSSFMQEGYLRFSFATTEDQIRGGMELAKKTILALK